MNVQLFDIKHILIKVFIFIAAIGSICGVPFMSCKECVRQREKQPGRDTISFNVPIIAICDSMKIMDGLMDKLNPAKKQPRIKSWLVKDYEPEIIDINGNEFQLKNLKVQDLNVFGELNNKEKIRFYNLIQFFLKNNLTSCFPEKLGLVSKYEYFYHYRNYENINEEEYNRFVLLCDTNFNYNNDSVERNFKCLDKRDGLVLFKENYHHYLSEHSN